MGVPGLWDLLRPAAARTSLSTLAKEAFIANRHNLRALTIGIDASIWIFHAQTPTAGENPFLRTIFYKVASLLQQPVLPVFVFDGPNKPSRKRGHTVAGKFGTADLPSRQFKALLDACGLEWWNAPGEAEAELAVMNRQGKIDAVLSDDVDALLFGATCLLRNNSPTLSGAQASSTQANSSRSDLRHYEIFRSSVIRDLWAAKEGTKLSTEEDCRMAMILVALMAGGDYAQEGLESFGPVIAHNLAHAGFANFLKLYTSDPKAFQTELSFIHGQMIDELRTNSSKQSSKKNPARAEGLSTKSPTELFPAFALDAYLRPPTSPLHEPTQGWPGFGKGQPSLHRGKARNEGRGDLEGCAQACERFFEWGTKDYVVKSFAGETVGLFGSEILNAAREAVRTRRTSAQTAPISAPPSQTQTTTSRITSFFQSSLPQSQASSSKTPITPAGAPSHVSFITSTRTDPTNPHTQEYRVTFKPEAYISRVRKAMKGSRIDPKLLSSDERMRLGMVEAADATIPIPAEVKEEIRVWMPEYLVREAWPELVDAYEEKLRIKEEIQREKEQKRLEKEEKQRAKEMEAGKIVMKKPVMTKKKAAAGVNTEAFMNFFTQVPACSSSPIASIAGTEEAEEEVEEVVRRPARGRNKPVRQVLSSPSSSQVEDHTKLASFSRRPPLSTASSSLTSLSSGEGFLSPRRSRVRSTSTSISVDPDVLAIPTPRTRPIRSAKPNPIIKSPSPHSPSRKSQPRPGESSSRKIISLGKGGKDQPIDLCSSSDEETTPRTRVVLARSRSTIINSPSPRRAVVGKKKGASQTRTISQTQTQTVLSMPLVTRSKPVVEVKKAPRVLVVREAEDEMWMDRIRR